MNIAGRIFIRTDKADGNILQAILTVVPDSPYTAIENSAMEFQVYLLPAMASYVIAHHRYS